LKNNYQFTRFLESFQTGLKGFVKGRFVQRKVVELANKIHIAQQKRELNDLEKAKKKQANKTANAIK
jgi:hypothetical protein